MQASSAGSIVVPPCVLHTGGTAYPNTKIMTKGKGDSEFILHYCWRHRLLPLQGLQTTDGRSVEVIDPGLHNDDAGPDFFNAKLKIDGMLWVGNVEIHGRSSDWYQHGHDRDPRYDNVILHVVRYADRAVVTHGGQSLPQVQIDVPAAVRAQYEELMEADKYPPCYKVIPGLDKLTVHSWMSALEAERLEQKTQAIVRRVGQCDGDWEWAYFVTLARCYGFGINGDAFERWALSFPLSAAAHHRDDVFQLEALFLGQAGLLDRDAVPQRHWEAAAADSHYQRLCSEYHFLQHKFSLKPIDYTQWRYLRLRPQNFPQVRIAQLANMYYGHKTSLSGLVDCTTVEEAEALFTTQVTPYWETHYAFGLESAKMRKRLSKASLDVLVINVVVPMLFAYGRHKMDERLCDRALLFLDGLRAEHNNIIALWQACGLEVRTAADSQALIQLKKEYCDKKDCLRCRFGYEYLKTTK